MSTNTENKDAEQLYNRQMYVVGAETQKKYGATNVLMVGLSGAGLEIAKNLALTGVKSITLVDNSPIQWTDLCTNFFAGEGDVGKPRASTVASHLSELNRFVSVNVHKDADFSTGVNLPESLYQQHELAIFCNLPTTTDLVAENAKARKNNCHFVSCEIRGIVGSIFVDGGDNFEVLDFNGEECPTCIVTTLLPNGTVICHDDKKHECQEGDMIYFHGLQAPESLNSDPKDVVANPPQLFEVLDVTGPFSMKIKLPDAIAALEPSEILPGGGYLTTTKQKVNMKFKSLEASLQDPEQLFVNDVESKLFSSNNVHLVVKALHAYMKSKNLVELPAAALNAQEVVAAAKAAGIADEDVLKLIEELSPSMAGNVNAMAASMGGLASQEALKLCSGKFTPISQWLSIDFRETLKTIDPATVDRTPEGARYDGQILTFGRAWQNTVRSKSAFVVGSGALGCEIIKNMALMGVATDGKARVVLTDMDHIEMSNLSRQFLFRTQHIGHPKSTVAGQAAVLINPQMKVDAMTEKVAPETEHIFNSKFWMSIDFICNALDNVVARRYVDTQCVLYQLPLFESGTLGTKCNLQVVIPHLTANYGSTHDPPEKSIPACTLKNFPSAIEHTIQWARDSFAQHFESIPTDVNSYLSNPTEFHEALDREPNNKSTVLERVQTALQAHPVTLKDCIKVSRGMFDDMFDISMKQLLHNLPLDRVDDKGIPFWGGAKKPPTPIVFDASNDLHIDYVLHTAALIASSSKKADLRKALEVMPLDEVRQIASSIPSKEFIPKVVKYQLVENTNNDPTANNDDTPAGFTEEVMPVLPPVSEVAGCAMEPEEFEKDDDANHHIDYVTATSNLRASCYAIPIADRIRTKRIAGSIIPAMVTTTAFVTGMVGIELTKFLAGNKTLEDYRDVFVNIAVNLFTLSEPQVALSTTWKNEDTGNSVTWSIWDRIDMNEGRDVTLEELVDILEKKYELDIFMISLTDGKMLYNQFAKKPEKMKKTIADIVATMGPLPESNDHFALLVTGSYGEEDPEVPTVFYKFRNF